MSVVEVYSMIGKTRINHTTARGEIISTRKG